MGGAEPLLVSEGYTVRYQDQYNLDSTDHILLGDVHPHEHDPRCQVAQLPCHGAHGGNIFEATSYAPSA